MYKRNRAGTDSTKNTLNEGGQEGARNRIRVAHYCQGDIETIDYIRDQLTPEQYEGYLRGQVIKYISRYPHKGGVDDLYKAQTYLGWLIELKTVNSYSGIFHNTVGPGTRFP